LAHRLPTPKLRLPNRHNWTRYAVLASLVVALPLATQDLWFCRLCPAGILEGGIPVVLTTPAVHHLVGLLYWIKVGILALFLAWMVMTRRPFCRWVCPLGALWSPLNPISYFHLQVDQELCTQCHRCQNVCPVDISVFKDPESPACIRCLECVRECPKGCVTVSSSRWVK
jgi:polyferredoxin